MCWERRRSRSTFGKNYFFPNDLVGFLLSKELLSTPRRYLKRIDFFIIIDIKKTNKEPFGDFKSPMNNDVILDPTGMITLLTYW